MRYLIEFSWIFFPVLWTTAFAQQCTQPVLPTDFPAIGGDNGTLISGLWYIYRQMGLPVATNPRLRYNILREIFEPVTHSPAWLHYRQTSLQLDTNGSVCQEKFWTGMYISTGQGIGDEGYTEDGYLMRPEHYVILYHDYDNLLIRYTCDWPNVHNRFLCATPQIFVQTRKRPDQLSASETDAFDAIVTSIFSKYCVTVNDVPKNIFTSSVPDCPLSDPPACIKQEIQGMQTVVNITLPEAQAPIPSPTCKWPLTTPSAGPIEPDKIGGTYFVYRGLLPPDELPDPINSVVQFNFVIRYVVPYTGVPADAYWAGYTHYDTMNSTECVDGYIVLTLGTDGTINGSVSPHTAAGFSRPTGLIALHSDEKSLLIYGCNAQNLTTGVCDVPLTVHYSRKNPLEMSQADKDALDAVEDFHFGKYGCSSKDITLATHTADKPQCGHVPAPECLQTHVDGYLTLKPPPDNNIGGAFYG